LGLVKKLRFAVSVAAAMGFVDRDNRVDVIGHAHTGIKRHVS
jgi:hypothetical protein